MKARLFYVRVFGQPLFAQRMAEQGIQMQDLAAAADAAQVESVLQRAHVFQISSGVNDLSAGLLAGPALFERTPELLLVSTIGAGYDTVDVAECTRRGIAVTSQGGGANAQAVVEHTLAMMLALGKRVVEADRHLRRTPDLQRHRFVGHNTQGRTVGVIGFGHVGQGLARLCAQALQMRVLVHSSYADAAALAAVGAERASLDELLQASDYVAVCCALTEATRGLLGAAEFARMKRGAFFITTARGGIHDEEALLQALTQGHLAGAGLDVWDQEPPHPSHPLLQLDQVIATPHIGGATHESRLQAAELAAAQIGAALSGQQPVNLLNPQVWPRFMERLASAGLAAP